jgi:hypothetical protein
MVCSRILGKNAKSRNCDCKHCVNNCTSSTERCLLAYSHAVDSNKGKKALGSGDPVERRVMVQLHAACWAMWSILHMRMCQPDTKGILLPTALKPTHVVKNNIISNNEPPKSVECIAAMRPTREKGCLLRPPPRTRARAESYFQSCGRYNTTANICMNNTHYAGICSVNDPSVVHCSRSSVLRAL